jgi:hypothetical protein
MDCLGLGMACTSGGCKACTNATQCGLVANASPCVHPTCDAGVCGSANNALGMSCVAPAMPNGGMCNAMGACVPPAKYVFVTTGTFNDLFGSTSGGVAQADAKCVEAATGAGFTGTMWMSWTSDGTSSPATRFPTKSTLPYLNLDDVMVAMDWTGLTSGTLLHGIDVDQGHNTVASAPVWTGTTITGDPSGFSCSGWTPNGALLTATVGVTGSTTATWTQVTVPKACSNGAAAHLYCFQQ